MKEFKEELKKIDIIEMDYRNHNVVIYGMDRNYTESKYDTIYRILELFANEMNVRVHENSSDNCFWLGKRRGRRPQLVRFTRDITREEILDKAKMLKGLKIWIERDFDFCTRKVRRDLLPYMWKARKNGQRAVLKFDKLKIGDQLFDLDFCKKNLEEEEVNGNSLRRSNSQNLQGVERDNNRADRAWRSRSQSPNRNRRNQHVQETDDAVQKSSERFEQVDKNAAGGIQLEVNFRLGAITRVNNHRDQGNYCERNLETMTSPNGSIVKVNKQNSASQSYNLRNWVTKKI